ncbi:MAG: hypothetical protein Q3998_03335 [Porphyromonas sp.]|nr:hypothetical protein [Porphyromonas sp.]
MEFHKKAFYRYIVVSALLMAAFFLVIMMHMPEFAVTILLYLTLVVVTSMIWPVWKSKKKTLFKVPLFYILYLFSIVTMIFTDQITIQMMALFFTLLDGLYIFYMETEDPKKEI